MNWTDFKNRTIILASVSPRRAALLQQVGMPFVAEPSHVHESDFYVQAVLPESVIECARLKAFTVADRHEEGLIIGADTIVTLNGTVYEKPRNRTHAVEILQALSGKTHDVYTGVAVIAKPSLQVEMDFAKTAVTFRTFDEDTILSYIDTGEPFDKAGAYGIQGKGALLVESIHGCYYNIVGLPLSLVYNMLNRFIT